MEIMFPFGFRLLTFRIRDLLGNFCSSANFVREIRIQQTDRTQGSMIGCKRTNNRAAQEALFNLP